MALLKCGLCGAVRGEKMMEAGVECLTSLIKQHKWLDL